MENSNQSQNHRWIIGIDVSKESLHICLINNVDGQVFNGKFNNNLSGCKSFKAWCKKRMLANVTLNPLLRGARRPVHPPIRPLPTEPPGECVARKLHAY